MTIQQQRTDNTVTLSIEGRLDTITAPEAEKTLDAIPEDVQNLILDLDKLEYLSSAGLRVLLRASKKFSTKGGMVVTNVNEVIMEIFEVTGFDSILDIR